MKNMKNNLIAIFTDLTFLLFILFILSHLLSLWLGLSIWWTAKYGLGLFACNTTYILVQKGYSILLVTTIISSIVIVVFPFFL